MIGRDETKEQIRILVDEACCHRSVNRSTFIRILKTELTVPTVKGNALVFKACSSQLARKTGKALRKGATCPHTQLGLSLLRIYRTRWRRATLVP